MDYPERFEQAKEYADSATTLMGGQQIAPNPRNFTIWYSFFTGRFPDLTKKIEEMVAAGQKFTEQVAEDLYHNFFLQRPESAVVSEVGGRIEAAVKRVLEFVGQAGDDNNRYGKALNTFSGELTKADQIGDIRGLVSDILAETKRMETHHRKLESDLKTSVDEVSDLRETLKEAQEEARTDPLTGLANRKQFDLQLANLCMDAAETKSPVILLMLDIDKFKDINDNWGHLVGDHVLKLIAKTLIDSIKGRDLAARYGGEEFSVILPATELDDAVIVANQIRAAIEAKRVIIKSTGENIGTITVSIGVALFRPGESEPELVQRADEALYAAKAGGRNQVVTEKTEPVPIAANK